MKTSPVGRGVAPALFAGALGLSGLLTSAADATWSIIIVDTRTKEIAIGSATCLVFFDLQRGASVVVPEVGAAAAQSYVDGSGQNRLTIYQQLKLGTDPSEILEILEDNDSGHQTRQYGIVDAIGRSATFTGTGAGGWAGGLTGQDGTLVYSIQGNVLTGEPVVTAAEQAILATDGDLAEKLMAAMEAARLYGGDGRCSCPGPDPEACGAPPPDFEKSAHIGYMIVSRPGDTDGGCSQQTGCAAGDYYLNFNLPNQSSNQPDPVYQLRDLLDEFRLEQIGRPDAVRSVATLGTSTLVLGEIDTTTLVFELLDWQGDPVTSPITDVEVRVAESPFPVVRTGPVQDLGGGRYSVNVSTIGRLGSATMNITVNDGIRPVRLAPSPTLDVELPSGSLALSPLTPGLAGEENSLCASGGTPGATVYFGWSWDLGVTNTPCGPIALMTPVIAGRATVEASGIACVARVIPSSARRQIVHMQAVEAGSCRRSNLVDTQFP